MININQYDDRYNTAIEQKKDPKYTNRLRSELTKPEWQESLTSISNRMQKANSKNAFEECERDLKALFEKLFETITAPGLDDLLDWMENMINKKGSTSKFRSFLLEDFVKYGDDIDEIISAKDQYHPQDNALFDDLISNFDKMLKKHITYFLEEEEFADSVDDFLEILKYELQGFVAIPELAFTKKEELYTEEQMRYSSISSYDKVIEDAIDACQAKAYFDDESKDSYLYAHIKDRIKMAKDCIDLLYNSGIADNDDETIKYLFARFRKIMINNKENVYNYLNKYLYGEWSGMLNNYQVIKVFHEKDDAVINPDPWKSFELGKEIDALVSKTSQLKKNDILDNLKNLKEDEIKEALSKSAKDINSLSNKENELREELDEHISSFIETYKRKEHLLSSIVASNTTLQSKYNTIYGEGGCLTTLRNGINGIKNEDEDLLSAINKYLPTMIDEMEKAKSTYEETMKLSGLSEEIEWLNQLEFDEGVCSVGKESFDANKIEKLLRNQLISLNIIKEV